MRLDSDDFWQSNHASRMIDIYKRDKSSLIITEKKDK